MKEKILRACVGTVATLTILAAGLFGLAHSQSGGGFPSQPTFNKVTINNATTPNGKGLFVTSGSAATDKPFFVTNQAQSAGSSFQSNAIGSVALGNVSPTGTNTFNVPATTNDNLHGWYLINGAPVFAVSRIAFNGAGAPTAVACNHCGTFSVTRNSVGSYTITHNANTTNASYTLCTRAGNATVGTLLTMVVTSESSTAFTILIFNSTPSLADPPATEAAVCMTTS